MAAALKIILRILLIVVIVLALIIGAIWGFVYVKFKVNAFSVLGSINELGKPVDTSVVAPNAMDYATDMASAQIAANASIHDLITKDSDDNYSINDEALPIMLADMTLSDKEMCAILTTLMMTRADKSIKIGDIDLKDYDLRLVQLSFSDLNTTNKTTKFNAVISLNLTSLKDHMTAFPLSMLKGRVPEKIYISSTVVVTKGTNAWEYSVASESLTINNLAQNKIEELLTLANNFVDLGTLDELNQTIGSTLVNAVIGNASNTGFAYTLHTPPASATDFNFVQDGDNVKLTIKKPL
ncbi:MAG: hypothetical protein IJU58_01505 [Clostridia bacterium]|nr:hypothetical protein [Clostridia bacterium]